MFPKDILVVDLENTGLDLEVHEIIQIGAVLLDKYTLAEKQTLEVTIKPVRFEQRDPNAMDRNHLTWEDLKDGVSLQEGIGQLLTLNTPPVILAAYGDHETRWLHHTFQTLQLPYPFDYHTLDIWSLALIHLAKQDKLTNTQRFEGFAMEDAFATLSIPSPERRHTALLDARCEAEILRRIVNS
jgi:DNA polymerase III epsilon subunit-like protein